MSSNVLPDCRTQHSRKMISLGQAGNWIPVFCANCGKPGGAVPEENMTFVFYLCNLCVESYGAVANTLMIPDEMFFAEIAAEQNVKRQKDAQGG